MVHASECLTTEKRNPITAIVRELSGLDPKVAENTARVKDLLSELAKHPVKFIPVKREFRIDSSKSYPYRSKKRGG